MNLNLSLTLAFVVVPTFSVPCARTQSLDLNPTRPTIANSASIPPMGVLQVEIGHDAYPEVVPGDQQTTVISAFYVPASRLRLDFGWAAFNSESTTKESHSGVGTLQLGGKVVLHQEEYGRPLPGVALQYEATLPTASDRNLQEKGQQFLLLLNHHYGRDGLLDVILNGSLVQSGCADPSGCHYGGQQSLALSLHLHEKTRLYAEVFGQNNSQSDTPPGTYAFGGFYHKFSDSFGLDGGVRFGLSERSASFGPTLGLVFGNGYGLSRRVRLGRTSRYASMKTLKTGVGHVLAPWPFLVFGIIMALTALFVCPKIGLSMGAMISFDAAAVVFCSMCLQLFRFDAQRMREAAERHDANRVGMLLIAAVVTGVILVSVGSELAQKGRPKPLDVALVVGTLCLSWVFSTLVYTLHYAHLFYVRNFDGKDMGGLDFPHTEEPDYWDFAYFSSCLAMTFQTSDVDMKSRTFRKTAMFHCLGAFVFNIGVIAFSINILGGS